MASSFKIRQSKYRHVYADEPKQERCWSGMLLSTVTGEQQYIKASAKYFAVALRGGGGPMAVCRLDRPGRFEPGTSQILEGHTGAVLDFDWNPFDDNMLASASEDSTIKIWSIPDEWEPTDAKGDAKSGQNLSESLVDLQGHRKKVTLVKFNPTAANVLASTAADASVKIWDIERGEELSSYDQMGDLTQDIAWDFTGDHYATSCKDKIIRLHDGRTGMVTTNIQNAHEGVKSVKITYLADTNKFLSTGTSKQSAREIKVWDIRNTASALYTEKIDTGSGVLLPIFDNDSGILYLCGKGDSTIRLYEFEDRDPYIFKLNDGYRSNVSTKGVCIVPKRGNDILACETARLLKLTNEQVVQPLSFIVPRKSDAFQADIFPDCPAPESAHTAEQWLAGSSKSPITICLDPAKKNHTSKDSQNGAIKRSFKVRTVAVVEAELKDATARIHYLENKLKENGISY